MCIIFRECTSSCSSFAPCQLTYPEVHAACRCKAFPVENRSREQLPCLEAEPLARLNPTLIGAVSPRPTESLVSVVTRLGKCLDDGCKCLDDGKNDFKKRPRGEYALSPLRLSLSIFYAL